MNINDRIKKIRMDLCDNSNKLFAEKLNVSTQYASNITKQGKNVGDKMMDNIINAFPMVDPIWLKMGKGSMFKTTEDLADPSENNSYNLVPVYNFDAVGGMYRHNDITDSPAYVERYVPFIGARKEDICVHVTGNSMAPTYCPGSLLLVREIQDWREYFGYGHCFVIFLRDGRRILKEVQKFTENPKEYIMCVSHNKEYPAEELPRKMITAVYKVIMALTNEGF